MMAPYIRLGRNVGHAAAWLTVCGVFGLAQAQSVRGPGLGYIRDVSGTTIAPIIGVPGAAAVAAPLDFGVSIRNAAISPGQNYVIAIRDSDSATVVIDLRVDSPQPEAILGGCLSPSLIAISPTGSSAALYEAETRRVQIVGHLLQTPEVLAEFDAPVSGAPIHMALSDDGSVVLLNVAGDESAEGRGLWVVSRSFAWNLGIQGAAAPVFFSNRHDAVAVDDATQSVILLRDLAHVGFSSRLYSSDDGAEPFSSIGISSDAREVYAARPSGALAVIDVQTLRATGIHCDCRPSQFRHLKPDSLLQISDGSGEPIAVLDRSSGGFRVFIIPQPSYQLPELKQAPELKQ